MTDDATTDGIPNAATVTTVDAYIQARRPVTADVTVAGPVASALNISINNVEPSTQAVMDAIEAELADLIRRESEPGGTLLVSHIREAISTSAGETDHELTSPVADVTVQATQITTLGNGHLHDELMVESVNRDAYREQIHALLPAGRAWPEEADTTLDALVRAMASQVAEVDRSASNLLTDILPNTTFNLLARLGAGRRAAGHMFGAGIVDHGSAGLAAGKAGHQAEPQRDGVRADRPRRSAPSITVEELDQTRADAIVGLDTSGGKWRFVWWIGIPLSADLRYFTDDVAGKRAVCDLRRATPSLSAGLRMRRRRTRIWWSGIRDSPAGAAV